MPPIITPEIRKLNSKLAIGNDSFCSIRERKSIYIDKTHLIYQLLAESDASHYFLSRPRRFGKSLLLRTIGELFKGNEPLFEGLYIYDKWDWSRKFPVIRLDLSTVEDPHKKPTVEVLETELKKLIIAYAKLQKIQLDVNDSPPVLFRNFIHTLYLRTEQKVVVLIDEYDVPVITQISSPERADKAKKLMHTFYKVLKENSDYIQFIMLTGITKFSGLSVFSALNNLVDISLKPEYSAICGYTEAELNKYFTPFMEAIDKDEFREMYNGYNWLGESVYNPIDVMMAIQSAVSMNKLDEFESYWFETGTPTFLAELMKKRGVLIPDLNEKALPKRLFTEIDVQHLSVEAALFQTGYLTIKERVFDKETKKPLYHLKYPNLEVSLSYNEFFLTEIFKDKEESDSYQALNRGFIDALKRGDCKLLFDEIHRFFASLSHDWYRNNKIASAEGFYCGILFALCRANAGCIEAESQTNHGQIDLFVKTGSKHYVIEVKVSENAKGTSGLTQILQKGYAQKYPDNTELYLIGMEFSSEKRNIVEMEYCIGMEGERITLTPDASKPAALTSPNPASAT